MKITITKHLQERIKNANKTYCKLQQIFRNKIMSNKLKLRLKNTIRDKILTYASETWVLTKTGRKQIIIF
jgi:CRISPR/Cas system CMR-associated protein Cmr3 (group 5 of RAMP superfamily)